MEKKNKATEKIKKLLALATNNPNENERTNALARAQKLIAEFDISEQELNVLDKHELMHTKTISCQSKGMSKVNTISLLVEKITSTYIVFKKYRVKPRVFERTITFYGRQSNVSIAAYMYEYLLKEFDRRWQKYYDTEIWQKMEGNVTDMRHSFYQGIYVSLLVKIQDARKETNQEYGLIVGDEKARIGKLVEEEMKVSPINREKHSLSIQSRFAGIKAGKDISINQQLSESDEGSSVKLLA